MPMNSINNWDLFHKQSNWLIWEQQRRWYSFVYRSHVIAISIDLRLLDFSYANYTCFDWHFFRLLFSIGKFAWLRKDRRCFDLIPLTVSIWTKVSNQFLFVIDCLRHIYYFRKHLFYIPMDLFSTLECLGSFELFALEMGLWRWRFYRLQSMSFDIFQINWNG